MPSYTNRTATPNSIVHKDTTLLPYAALMAAVCFWGGSFVATRAAVKVMHPQGVMLCRMIIACLVLLPFANRLAPSTWKRGDLKLILPMVALQPCLYFLFESNALKLTTASQAGVISSFVPLLVGVGAWAFLSEKLSHKTAFGLILSLGGVAILTASGKAEAPGDNPLLGNSLEMLAMTCAAGNMLIVKQLTSRYSPWTLTGMQCLTGLVFFSPGIRYLATVPGGIFHASVMIPLVFLGVFASVGAFGLYNWAMSRLPANQASAFINLVPVVAVVLGWGILGETLAPLQIAGAVIVGAGVVLSQTAAVSAHNDRRTG